MPAMPAHHRTSERAFTLGEIVVVMVIAAILMAVASNSLGGVRRGTTNKRAVSVVRAYDESVRAFQLDHDGRPPDPAVPAEWAAGSKVVRGPLDLMRSKAGALMPYMRTVPESVQSGEYGVVAARSGGASIGSAGAKGSITYTYYQSLGTYDIVASTPAAPAWACIVGNSTRARTPTGGMKAC